MLDFADLLTVVADGVKRKPNKKPDQQPLPSEEALGEVVQGAEESASSGGWKSHKETMDAALPGWNDPFGKYVGGDAQASATEQGVADEPANADNIQTTTPEMGMKVYPRPQIDVPPAPQDMPVAPKAERRKLSIDEQIAQAEDERQTAQEAPIQKQSFWKDFGAKLIQGADVFFNGTKAPIVGWGRLKHDAAVDRANAKLNPLLGMRKEQEDSAYRQARTGTILNDDKRQDQAAKDLAKYRADMIAAQTERDKANATERERTRTAKRKMYLNTNQRKRDEIQGQIAEIEIETKATEAALAKDIADLGKTPPNKKAEITRLKSAIARKQDKLRERSGDIEKHKKRQAAIVDVEDGELADTPNVNEDLMKSIRANAPQGATEEQIRAAYLRALNE